MVVRIVLVTAVLSLLILRGLSEVLYIRGEIFHSSTSVQTNGVSVTVTSPMDALVDAMNFTPLPHDEYSVDLQNPFNPVNQTVTVDFIIDTGAQYNLLPVSTAVRINLPLSSRGCSLTGLNSTSYGALAVATVLFIRGSVNVTFCVTDLTFSILSKNFVETQGLCHCPGVPFKHCP